jgi:regulator of protease activity HflC (stomatin/prohibitin superfamily)
MTSFVTWLQGLARPFKPWVIVKPWEQGVRVRFGKNVRLLQPGMYWKLPLFDSVSVLPVRVRAVTMPTMNAMTSDGRAVTLGMAMEYQIEDVELVFRSVHNPEQTLMYRAQGAAAELLRSLHSSVVSGNLLEKHVTETVDVATMDLGAFRCYVTDLALVRTFRLIQDGRWSADLNADTMAREA